MRAATATPNTTARIVAVRSALVTKDRVCVTYSCIGMTLAAGNWPEYSSAIEVGSAPVSSAAGARSAYTT